MQTKSSEETRRFWDKVVKGETPGACWVWVGAIGADGYGRFWVKDPESEAGEKNVASPQIRRHPHLR